MTLDAKTLDTILHRGVAEIIVEEEFVELFQAGKPLRLKMGLDPSSPDIHLGHAVGLRKLRQLQELGHQVVLIVGDWTARIGDPSGMSATRRMLTQSEVEANAETYMRQLFKVVDRSKTQAIYQSEWFGKFDLEKIIRLTSRFTVAQFLAREDFSKRYKEGRPIAITELLYPLMQAYDSIAVKSDVEFGGVDQRFNLLVGRELQAMEGQRPQQCFLMPLLVGTDGVLKMSKSLGNYIGIDETPNSMYGKTMSLPDSLIIMYLENLTDTPDQEITEMRRSLDEGLVNPMELKKRLATELVLQFHGASAAHGAGQYFERTVQRREAPEDITDIWFRRSEIRFVGSFLQKEMLEIYKAPVQGGIFQKAIPALGIMVGDVAADIPHLLVKIGLANSVREGQTLLEQGGITINEQQLGPSSSGNPLMAGVHDGTIIRRGRRKHRRIRFWD